VPDKGTRYSISSPIEERVRHPSFRLLVDRTLDAGTDPMALADSDPFFRFAVFHSHGDFAGLFVIASESMAGRQKRSGSSVLIRQFRHTSHRIPPITKHLVQQENPVIFLQGRSEVPVHSLHLALDVEPLP